MTLYTEQFLHRTKAICILTKTGNYNIVSNIVARTIIFVQFDKK